MYQSACSLIGTYMRSDSLPSELSAYTENQRREAMRKFHVLQLFLEEGVPLSSIAHREGISVRTIRRWLVRYRANGLQGLVRDVRNDRGTHGDLSEAVVTLIEGLTLKTPRQSVASIYRHAKSFAVKNGLRSASYSTVLAIANQVPKPLIFLAHEGTKAYKEKYDFLSFNIGIEISDKSAKSA
jgi:putative transposase